MKRLAWLTDGHLNFLSPLAAEAFIGSLAKLRAGAFLVSSDVGEAPDVDYYLDAFGSELARPVYFALGNHDFYRGSITGVREKVEALCIASSNLHWMPRSGVVPLTEETCLVVSPDRQMTVLCGHTHGAGEAQVLPNLKVLTGGAVYGKPALRRALEVE